jgi:hypothetical protein
MKCPEEWHQKAVPETSKDKTRWRDVSKKIKTDYQIASQFS